MFSTCPLIQKSKSTFQHLLQWKHGALQQSHDDRVTFMLAHVDLQALSVPHGHVGTGLARAAGHRAGVMVQGGASATGSLVGVALGDVAHLLGLRDPVHVTSDNNTLEDCFVFIWPF